MAKVSIQTLKKQFGASVAVSDFSLEIADGELVALLGPSGCGKTTTLRMIAGFIDPTAGTIFIGDKDVTRVPVHKRNTGMVFQRYALFPHMTVAENVSFGMEMHKVPAAEREARIRAALDMVRMTQLRDRYPRQLSGGQRQPSPSRVRWRSSRRCFCWTSRCPTWTPSCVWKYARRSAACSAGSV